MVWLGLGQGYGHATLESPSRSCAALVGCACLRTSLCDSFVDTALFWACTSRENCWDQRLVELVSTSVGAGSCTPRACFEARTSQRVGSTIHLSITSEAAVRCERGLEADMRTGRDLTLVFTLIADVTQSSFRNSFRFSLNILHGVNDALVAITLINERLMNFFSGISVAWNRNHPYPLV